MSIIWKVVPFETPTVERNCNKCGGKSHYRANGQFRVNANGRNLDIWLIYKCVTCDNTWNLTVHERVKPESLPAALYQAYLGNDAAQATRCAFDKSLLLRNQVQPCYDGVTLAIEGPHVNPYACEEPIDILLRCEVEPGVRLGKLLSQKLGISHSACKRLAEQGVITIADGADVQKTRVRDGLVVRIGGGAVTQAEPIC